MTESDVRSAILMFGELKNYLETAGVEFPTHNPDENPKDDWGSIERGTNPLRL
jgi:hypothetical protein